MNNKMIFLLPFSFLLAAIFCLLDLKASCSVFFHIAGTTTDVFKCNDSSLCDTMKYADMFKT